MGSMAKIMKQKAVTIKATSANRSSEVVKTVSKSEFLVLNRRMEPILRENERERIASENAVAGSLFGSRY